MTEIISKRRKTQFNQLFKGLYRFVYVIMLIHNANMKENCSSVVFIYCFITCICIRHEKIIKMCNVMGIDLPHDPDDTYELTTDNVKKIMAIFMRFR